MLGWRPTNIPVLSILLQAGKEWRIEQLARRFSIERDEAARRIKRPTKPACAYQQHYFNAHIYDCALYDLVLNTEVLGLENDGHARDERGACARLGALSGMKLHRFF